MPNVWINRLKERAINHAKQAYTVPSIGAAYAHSVTDQLRLARHRSAARVWRRRTQALEQLDDWLDLETDRAVLSWITWPAERAVQRCLHRYTDPPLDNYEARNAKDIIRNIKTLRTISLLRLLSWEQTHKQRKTVIRAAEKELTRRSVPLTD